LLLTRNGITDIAEDFKVHKHRNVVAFGESFDQFLLVLRNTALEVVGYTCVFEFRLKIAVGDP